MPDFKRVEAAQMFPFRCVFCPNQKDVIDTGVELLGNQYGYLCRDCARNAARLFGWSKGKEQERLSNAAEIVEALEQERDQYKAERDDSAAKFMETGLALDSALKENAQLKGRVLQLQSRIAEEARAALELVGGDAA